MSHKSKNDKTKPVNKPAADKIYEDDIPEVKVISSRTHSSGRRFSGSPRKKDIYDWFDLAKEVCTRNKKQLLCLLVVVLVLILLIVGNTGGCGRHTDNSATATDAAKATGQTQTQSTEPESETEPETAAPVELTISPEAEDSEITTLISNFYQAYIISGSLDELGKYIDSTTGFDESRLSINQKYIESVSGFTCYQSDSEIIDDTYTVLIVTYKIKLYNYDELLPSIDILFLVNGSEGYRVHNLTVDDNFERQKLESDSNFQILRTNVSEELNALLAANSDLNEVYQLYLNPETAGQ